MEISENTVIGLNIRTIIVLVGIVVASISTFFATKYMVQLKYDALLSEISKAKELPKPGTGIYVIDPADPQATQTWAPTRMEYNMKDQASRKSLTTLSEDIKELKTEIEKLKEKH